MVFFFFFQAEDGIRDVAVTGVQTCALPISSSRSLFRFSPATCLSGKGASDGFKSSRRQGYAGLSRALVVPWSFRFRKSKVFAASWKAQIGRASCRERV